MPANYGCIILVTREWFDRCLERGCTVYCLPPGHMPRVGKLTPGSLCLVLAKSGRTPRTEWAFVGEFTVRGLKYVKGEEFHAYAPRAVEVPGAPFPRPGEVSWVIEFDSLVRYPRPVRLGDCTDVRTSTSLVPMSRWRILGFTLIRPSDVARVVEAVRAKAGYGPG